MTFKQLLNIQKHYGRITLNHRDAKNYIEWLKNEGITIKSTQNKEQTGKTTIELA